MKMMKIASSNIRSIVKQHITLRAKIHINFNDRDSLEEIALCAL